MSKIIDRTGKGSNISQAENDSNLDSLHGINQAIAGLTHTVTIADQGDTLEFTSGSAVAVTLDDIATILGAAHTSDFQITIVCIGAGTVTITPDGTDSFNIVGATYVLEQNEYVTLQTDSTNAIWNIINASNARSFGGLYSHQFVRSDVADAVAGVLTFAGNNVHNGDETFNGADTHTGGDTFTGNVGIDGGWDIGGTAVSSTAAELNLLDGVTWTPTDFNALSSTVTELNILDASAAAGSYTIDLNDGIIMQVDSVMRQVDVDSLDTYFAGTTKTLVNKTLTAPVIAAQTGVVTINGATYYRTYSGVINGVTGNTFYAGGAGLSVSNPSTGIYRITHNFGSTSYSVVASTNGNTVGTSIGIRNTNTIDIEVDLYSGGASAVTEIHFQITRH